MKKVPNNSTITGSYGYYVVITKTHLVHNHPFNRDTFIGYAKNRLQLDDTTRATVNAIRKAGANRKKILQYIVENSGCEPSIRDVHNLVAKLKAEERDGATTDDRMKQ